MNGVPLLSTSGLIVERAGRRILELEALSFAPGEVTALLGPNGAGKSTLLLCLAGLSKPSAGAVLFKGAGISRSADSLNYRRRIGMVFQEPLLLNASVYDNVAAGLRMRGTPQGAVAERVRESLARFRIESLERRHAKTLSGGEAQRTSLARAFAVSPEVLFLDEPFAALDAPTRESILEDLAQTLRRTGTTAIFATHDRNEALRLADRMLLLREGRLVQDATPEAVMNQPADEWTASFVGMETLVPGKVLSSGGGVIAVATRGATVCAIGEAVAGDAVLLGFRPEHVTLSRADQDSASSARNRFPCVVTRVERQGFWEKVHLDAGFPLTALVSRPSLEELSIAPGARLTASVKATAIHLIRRG